MKTIGRGVLIISSCLFFLILPSFSPPSVLAAKVEKVVKGSVAEKVSKPIGAFDASKMSDMSDYDPLTVTQPTGDTVKIAIVSSFSGPAAGNGQMYWLIFNWVTHDINKRGGIFVDGKKKLIELFKADHMGKPDQTKKIVERMILLEKVHVLIATDGSHLNKIINETANKYKVIAMNASNLSDDLQDATNFCPYAFHCAFSTEQVGRGFAYFYGQIRKKETKFYILNQDYSFGHQLAEGFKKGLQEYYPQAQIVGEDYHKLFLTDFAPYLTKVKASGAEVIYTGDWDPDATDLQKQARQLGIKLPFANIYADNPNTLHELGTENVKGMISLGSWWVANPQFRYPGYEKIYKAWER